MKLGKPVYVQKPLCNTLHETRMLTEEARRRGLTTQMGIQVSSSTPQRYGEALVRSGIVGKIREVHTFSNKNWGDDKPLPALDDPVPRRARLGRLARRERGAAVQERRVSPGRMAPARRLRDRHARRHGLSYLQPAVSRAEVDVARLGHRLRAAAHRGELGHEGPREADLSGHRIHRRQHRRHVVVRRRRAAARRHSRAVGARFPQQGSVVVGTDGMLVLPHGSTPAFALPDAKTASLPQIDLPDRDHYAEFIDAALGGGKDNAPRASPTRARSPNRCSSATSRRIFPARRSSSTPKALSFPRRREANDLLTRSYRRGWSM